MNNNQSPSLLWRIVTLIYMIGLIGVSLKPAGSLGGNSLTQQMFRNILHAPAYSILFFFIYCCFKRWDLKRLTWNLLFCIAFGGLNELIQSAVPGRMASLSDMIVNTIGAGGMFAILYFILLRRTK